MLRHLHGSSRAGEVERARPQSEAKQATASPRCGPMARAGSPPRCHPRLEESRTRHSCPRKLSIKCAPGHSPQDPVAAGSMQECVPASSEPDSNKHLQVSEFGTDRISSRRAFGRGKGWGLHKATSTPARDLFECPHIRQSIGKQTRRMWMDARDEGEYSLRVQASMPQRLLRQSSHGRNGRKGLAGNTKREESGKSSKRAQHQQRQALRSLGFSLGPWPPVNLGLSSSSEGLALAGSCATTRWTEPFLRHAFLSSLRKNLVAPAPQVESPDSTSSLVVACLPTCTEHETDRSSVKARSGSKRFSFCTADLPKTPPEFTRRLWWPACCCSHCRCSRSRVMHK